MITGLRDIRYRLEKFALSYRFIASHSFYILHFSRKTERQCVVYEINKLLALGRTCWNHLNAVQNKRIAISTAS